jgi:hypothetical protein
MLLTNGLACPWQLPGLEEEEGTGLSVPQLRGCAASSFKVKFRFKCKVKFKLKVKLKLKVKVKSRFHYSESSGTQLPGEGCSDGMDCTTQKSQDIGADLQPAELPEATGGPLSEQILLTLTVATVVLVFNFLRPMIL